MKTPQSLPYIYVSLAIAAALSGPAATRLHAQVAVAPGGILEPAQTTVVRTTAASVPLPARGVFTFPAPYSTRGVRLTNGTDCGGADCVTSVGYAYWRNMNNHVGSSQILIVLTLSRNKGGAGPTLFSYNKTTGETRNLGPLFAASSALSWATGEGWYFSATMPSALYLNSGSQMLRYDVATRALTKVVDVADFLGTNRSIWQMHSSNDDAVHSFTVRDTNGSTIYGCGVYFERQQQFRLFPAKGEFDECQIDKSGRYLVIKENADGLYAYDNVIEDLTTGGEMFLPDQAGALGHSDLGFGYGVGEDNWNALPGAVRVWQYDTGAVTNGRVVFHATDWNFGASHVAHSDAQATLPLDQQMACSSNASRLALPHTNEILCYRLDGSQNVLVVAPVMTNLDASGGGASDYEKEPKGNLDVTGEFFLWTSNVGGARQDAFIVQVPRQTLVASSTTASPTPTPGPTPAPTSSLVPAPITWVNQVNVTVSGTTLKKTRGCAGCADAGATSSQQIVAGDGYFEFVASDAKANRVMGLSHGNTGTSATEIQFGIRINRGVAEVRERGTYRSDTSIMAGDRLRVQVVAGRVSYARNGTVFYSSQASPTYPLLVDSSFNDIGATLSDGVLAIPSGVAAAGPAAKQAPEASSFWTGLLNAVVTSTGLQKAGGCEGCPDSGAVSVQAIPSGNVRLEFTAGGAGLRFVGLGPSPAPGVGTDLPFAFRLENGVAEVREYGVYVTDVAVSPSDVLSIAVVNGRVQYARNGAVFYTSGVAAMYPLRASAAIYALGAVVAPPAWQTP